MSYQMIEINDNNSIAYITLNRPNIRNAMNSQLVHELTDVFKQVNQNSDIRIIVLSGKGQSFCAGVDLKLMKELGQMSYEKNVESGYQLERMYHEIDQCSKAVIGKIHGHAYGGGFGLCAVCDIVVASEETTFCLSEVLIGIVPAVIGPYTIKKIGHSHFRALGISGEKFDAKYGEKIGLVHYAVQNEKLDEVTNNVINQLLKASPTAVSRFKEYCREMETINSAELIAELRASKEGREGLSAILENRPPSWSD